MIVRGSRDTQGGSPDFLTLNFRHAWLSPEAGLLLYAQVGHGERGEGRREAVAEP